MAVKSATPKPNFSAIIPVTRMHGRLRELEQILRSNDFPDLEVVIVHDKQDDYTGKELLDLVQKYEQKNVTFVEGEFNSPGLARNRGFELATGRWIFFWDADDEPIISKFIEMTNEADRCGKKIAIGQFSMRIELGKKPQIVFQPQLNDVVFQTGLWRMAFRRERISDIKFKNYRMGEDQFFLAETNLKMDEIYFSPDVVYTYNNESLGQLTRDMTSKKTISETFESTCNAIKSLPKSDSWIFRKQVIPQLISVIKYANIETSIRDVKVLRSLYIGRIYMTRREILRNLVEYFMFKIKFR